MGNTCAGLGFSRSGLHVIWWTRADRAIKCDDRELCIRNLEKKTNHHNIHLKPPEHVMMVVRDKTELSDMHDSRQGFIPAEKSNEPKGSQEEGHPAEPQARKADEEENSARQPKNAEVDTSPVRNGIPEGESMTGAGKAVGNKKETQAVKPVIYKNPQSVKSIPSIGLHMESVLQTKKGYFKEYYSLGKKIGHGQYGTTFLCFEKSSGKQFACKCIPKRKLVTMEQVEDVRREIQIMHHLAGHPNVIEIKGAYEDPVTVFVVMELCTGGELFDRVTKRGHYTEKKAAELARTIISVVAYCHSLGVFHRDLKPENFLFVNEVEESPMKTIDYGLSEFFNQGDTFTEVVGSPYYVAPEVLSRSYGPEADVWSAGVIVYILLCGVPPFWGENDEELFQEIMQEELDFSFDPWPAVSESAKDFLRKVLVRNPKKRLSAYEALCHPWIREDGMALDRPLDSAVLSRLKRFSAMNKLKKMAIRVIAERLTDEEIAGLKEMFKAIDMDSSGQITFEELKVGLKKFGANINETEIQELLKAADLDNNGTIDYGEFVAATLHLHKVEMEDHLFAAFSYFDKDGSGYITQEELQQACDELGVEEVHLEEIIREVDQDNDGRIDFKEFVAMMQKENAELGKKSLKSSISTGFREGLSVF